MRLIMFFLAMTLFISCRKGKKESDFKIDTVPLKTKSLKDSVNRIKLNVPRTRFKSVLKYKRFLYKSCKNRNELGSWNNEIIYDLIPKSNEEYLEFYSLSENDSEEKCFDDLLEHFLLKLNERPSNFLFAILLMSNYVDGYVAEEYFESIDFIMSKESGSFCNVLNSRLELLPKFQEEFMEYCE